MSMQRISLLAALLSAAVACRTEVQLPQLPYADPLGTASQPLDDCTAPAPIAGAVYADCPAPTSGTAPGNIAVLNPETGEVSKTIDLSCFAENADALPRPYFLA